MTVPSSKRLFVVQVGGTPQDAVGQLTAERQALIEEVQKLQVLIPTNLF